MRLYFKSFRIQLKSLSFLLFTLLMIFHQFVYFLIFSYEQRIVHMYSVTAYSINAVICRNLRAFEFFFLSILTACSMLYLYCRLRFCASYEFTLAFTSKLGRKCSFIGSKVYLQDNKTLMLQSLSTLIH